MASLSSNAYETIRQQLEAAKGIIDTMNSVAHEPKVIIDAVNLLHKNTTILTCEMVSDAYNEIIKTAKRTHDEFYKLLHDSTDMTSEVHDKLTALKKENYEAREIMSDLYHIEQMIMNPGGLYSTLSQCPKDYSLDY